MRRMVVVLLLAAAAVVVATQQVTCEHEYSSNCIWWGPIQGNGGGSVVINGNMED